MKYMMKTLMGIFILTLLVVSVNAELYIAGEVLVNNQTQTVTHRMTYKIIDTSASGVGTGKYVPVGVYANIQPLPYDIGFYYPQYAGAIVDWCNYTVDQDKNIYDSQGHIINQSYETYNIFYNGSLPSGGQDYHQFSLLALDSLRTFVTCHYTDVRTLDIDGVLFGTAEAFFPAFECKNCESNSFQELARSNENVQQSISKEVSIYQTLQGLIKFNWNIWIILSWIFKIGMIFVAFMLLIKGIFFTYHFIKEIQEHLR